ncbi:MAG TPA: hypothetical protein VE988_16780, partial [Gemmataceae bacterium]|nr:hypothetical protein [Gemmataceae bacterium]
MSVRVHCPGCQSLYQLPDRLSGKTVRCKGCSATFVVPGGAKAIAAKPPTKKLANHDGAIQKTPQRAKTNPAAKGEKSPRSRKAMPLALVALFVGGIVVLGGGAGVYLWMTGDSTQPTQAAKAKPIVQPQMPAPVQPKNAPKPNLTEDTDDNSKDKTPTPTKDDTQSLDPIPEPQSQPKAEVTTPKKEVRPEKVEPKIETPNPDPGVVTAAVSYTKHIQPFMKQYCTS